MLEGSKSTLEKLEIDIGGYCPQKKELNIVISFLKGLANIRKLQLRSFEISDKQFLNDFAETVLQYKYLRVLKIGTVKPTVTKPAFYLAFDAMLKKRGLRVFHYDVRVDFMLSLKANSKTVRKMNMSQVRTKNPSLEDMSQHHSLFEDDISDRYW